MKTRILALMVLTGVLASITGNAETPPRSSRHSGAVSGVPLMPLSEVKRGQIGKVHTVFQGTEIEEFECEVIGILKDSIGPHNDMIMV
ncbi:MAG TPA: hypothetical protein VFV34_12545, partial [Blastocatellia bacterium]|nr:hypothetical protein [Blastocatellia bacterium]